MWTSPQKMLLSEMDERTRAKQRAAQSGDPDARAAYYAEVARGGNSEIIKNLAILGDKDAQAVFEPVDRKEIWSLQVRLELDVHESQSKNLAIMIVNELVDAYEERLDELIGDPTKAQGDGPVNPVFFAHHQEGLETTKRYYDRYNHLRNNEGTNNHFSNLEYELGGELNAGGRLYGMNTMTTMNSIIGIIGLACLVRISGFSEGEFPDRSSTRWSPGLAMYLGNALRSAQGQEIDTSGVMTRLRERLQSQLF